MDDLEPSLRRNVRIDGGTGQASVKDVVWAVTHRDGAAGSKLVASLADKYPEVAARFDRRRVDGKGQDVTVANFEILTDVIFLVGSPRHGCHAANQSLNTHKNACRLAGRGVCERFEADPGEEVRHRSRSLQHHERGPCAYVSMGERSARRVSPRRQTSA